MWYSGFQRVTCEPEALRSRWECVTCADSWVLPSTCRIRIWGHGVHQSVSPRWPRWCSMSQVQLNYLPGASQNKERYFAKARPPAHWRRWKGEFWLTTQDDTRRISSQTGMGILGGWKQHHGSHCSCISSDFRLSGVELFFQMSWQPLAEQCLLNLNAPRAS